MQNISEENLWLLCLEGDREAFKEMYCRFYSLLYHYGLKLVSDKELVKDCIQDIFVKIIQNHSTLSPTLNVKGYLIRTLRNKIIDIIEKERGMDDIERYGDNFIADDSFWEEEDKNPCFRFFMRAFSELSSHQQEIIYLYYVNELKHEEIAEILGINYQSSKNLLFRSLSKLKKIYFSKKHFFEKE
ncbi:MAG: sigma-70 family RNA polymerase sigma factor [Parabacteroides sp.]|nr:sigma-70 family RNA polymerase sigma factor [Parabacteroides sp.]